MNSYKQSLIAEHQQLVVKLTKLNNYIYSGDGAKDDNVEFANKCVQLRGMRMYEEALRARLNNVGIAIDENNYFEHVGAVVNSTIGTTPMPTCGSDYDADAAQCKTNTENE